LAVQLLIDAAEDHGPMMFAKMGMHRALNRDVDRIFNYNRRDTPWGKRQQRSMKTKLRSVARDAFPMTPRLKYAKVRNPRCNKGNHMKAFLTFVFAIVFSSPAWSQTATVVRGVGTQTCKTLVASDQVDEKFALQASQWILGNITAYFRQVSDNPSRSIGDAIVLQTVLDVCRNNPDKTIDEAVTLTIHSMPVTQVPKKPVAEPGAGADPSGRN
jgi:hypothetical protein